MGVRPDHKIEDGMSYLLAPFPKAQLKVVDPMLDVAADAVKAILTDGASAAMNRFNRKVETEKD
jgi:peptidyl-tRNA hydrolase